MNPALKHAALRWSPWLIGAAPVCAVLIGRTLAPAFGPAQSHAAEATAIDASSVALDPMPEARALATKFAAEAMAQEWGPSPFARVVAAPAPVVDESAAAVAPAPPPGPEPEPEAPIAWQVTSILADKRGGGAIAVINGKVRRAGDSVAPGWSVATIDASSGTVTLSGPRERTATITTAKRLSGG